MTSLDNILSGRSEPAPETDKPVETTPQAETTTENVAETVETPAEGEQPKGGDPQKMVPHEALHAEKQKVKRYTEEVSEFRKTNEALQRQVSELLQRVPVPKQEPTQVPDIFENAPAAVRSYIQPDLEAQTQRQYALARVISRQELGKEKFEEVTAAFDSAVQQGKVDQPTLQRIMSSPMPWLEAADWYDQQQRMAPDYEEKLRAKVEAEILAKHGLTTQPDGAKTPAAAPVMPSNLTAARNVGVRSGPAWAGPTPLGDIFKR